MNKFFKVAVLAFLIFSFCIFGNNAWASQISNDQLLAMIRQIEQQIIVLQQELLKLEQTTSQSQGGAGGQPVCSDGTASGQCSATKPMICASGQLTANCSQCGCPDDNPFCSTNGSCQKSGNIVPAVLSIQTTDFGSGTFGIALETDSQAICRYQIDSDAAYSVMTNVAVATNSGTHQSATISNLAVGQHTIYFRCGNESGASDPVFGFKTTTINVASFTASTKVLYPNGGEQLRVGPTYNITWTTSGLNSSASAQVTLLDTRYDPNLVLGEMVIANTTNGGSYSWTVPSQIESNALNGTQYKIKVYVAGGGSSKVDVSDGVFSILPQ